MAKNRTEEDWFLRGGERPSTKTPYDEPQVPDEGNPHDTDPCAECDGLTRCDDCPHNRELVEDDDETDDYGREFTVVISRFRTVKQEARVVVKADCEESAMEKAEELAEDYGDVWNWTDVEDSEDIEDVGAEEAEEH